MLKENLYNYCRICNTHHGSVIILIECTILTGRNSMVEAQQVLITARFTLLGWETCYGLS